MTGIPVVARFRAPIFDALERIAEQKGMSIGQLIVAHVEASLAPEPYSRTTTKSGRPLKTADVDTWVTMAKSGATNRVIAERWGVSEQLVSRTLIDRGIRRQKPKERAA